MQADAGSVNGAEAMVKSTIERFGRLDILILNAGEYIVSSSSDYANVSDP